MSDVLERANLMAKQGLISSQQLERISSMYGDVGGSLPEAYADPHSGIGGAIKRAAGSLASLPRRAIEGSATDMQNLGDHSQPLQSVGPAVDAALLMTGGAGAVPAEANSLRAGIRPFQKVPQSLMGYRKSGPQKGFGETNYPHKQSVEVTFKNGDTFTDAVEGMNPDHALERAYRNWPDAIHITAVK